MIYNLLLNCLKKNFKMSLKRNVPPPVKGILDIDSKLTSVICNTVSRFLPVRSFTPYYKGLEVKYLYDKKYVSI